MRNFRRRRTFRSLRRRGRGSQNRIRRPRNVNLQSKVVVFRNRTRYQMSVDPAANEMIVAETVPTFGQLAAVEYARGREEVVQFMRVAFAGLSISVKKSDCKMITRYPGGTSGYPVISNAKVRMNFAHGLYVSLGQLSQNEVGIDTCAGAARNISYRGRKCYRYKVPKHLLASKSVDAGSTFPASATNWTWPALVNLQNNETSTDIAIPDRYFIQFDNIPFPVTLPGTNDTSLTMNFDVRINYYFHCYGKRVNV